MKRLRRSIGIGAALCFLLWGAPTVGAAAAQGDALTSAQDGQGEQHQADVAERPPRKRPTTSAPSPAPQSNARARQVTCGQVITQNTVLRNDVGPCPGDGIVIGADNITLNLNGHRVLGNSDQGTSGEFAGIRLPGRTGVTVTGRPGGQASGRMATVSGFEAGVVIGGGSANTVEELAVRDNISLDDAFNAELGDGIVVFDSPGNRILNNVVVHNGIFDGIGVLGSASDNNVIQGNTVEDTVGTSDRGPAGQGIIVNGSDGFSEGLISGTRIDGNVVRKSASSGVSNINNTEAQIVGNTVEGSGRTNVPGIGIGVQAGFGYGGPGVATRVLIQDNEVHGNNFDGIQIRGGAHENRIINNNAADNNTGSHGAFPGFDLRDLNSNCGSNVWFGNVWGSGFYSPPCVTNGGSGPPLAPTTEGPEVSETTTCFDFADNDQDGLIDNDDSDCGGREGYRREIRRDGTLAPPDPRCSDGIDNDGDGLIDRDDDDCRLEVEGAPGRPACSNGSDDDEDGLTDGDDPDCFALSSEGTAGSRTCDDGIDNDADGLIDGRDPDCQEDAQSIEGPSDNRTCFDAVDNDLDGLIDDQDPDCEQPSEGPFGDRSCSDGIDNDGDNVIDADDAGCFPPVEGVPGDPPCLDGIDNDEDGLIDGDDPDCQEPIQP